MIYICTIQDKTLYGEPDIALAVVEAPDEATAARAADATIDELAAVGRCRCVPHVRAIAPGKFYRLGALVRLPPRDRDGDSVEVTDGELSDIVDALSELTGDKGREWRSDDGARRFDVLRERLATILATRTTPKDETP